MHESESGAEGRKIEHTDVYIADGFSKEEAIKTIAVLKAQKAKKVAARRAQTEAAEAKKAAAAKPETEAEEAWQKARLQQERDAALGSYSLSSQDMLTREGLWHP